MRHHSHGFLTSELSPNISLWVRFMTSTKTLSQGAELCQVSGVSNFTCEQGRVQAPCSTSKHERMIHLYCHHRQERLLIRENVYEGRCVFNVPLDAGICMLVYLHHLLSYVLFHVCLFLCELHLWVVFHPIGQSIWMSFFFSI